MPAFLPPEPREQFRRIASRNERRARRLCGLLRPASAPQREALAALDATLSSLRGSRRDEWLLEPGVRAWLSAAEEVVDLSTAGRDDVDLFDRVAAGPHLAEVAPHGRIDRRFRGRVSALASRLTGRLYVRLPGLLLFQTPPGMSFGPFAPDLAADAEEARAEGELHVTLPAPLTMRIAPGTKMLLIAGGVQFTSHGRDLRIEASERVPGTGIILGRRLVPSRTGRRPGSRVRGLGRTLSRALKLLRSCWREGHREVLTWTRLIIPLFERGTVSFSQPDRPGVSYIRIPGKSVIDLADDLLHETAHHRLHALEELGPLTRDDGEPRYFSPWRRAIRPVRGILHATYTFSYRAQLLSRLADTPGPIPRDRVRQEVAAERAALTGALDDLADANRRGLLTPAGARLLRSMHDRKPWLHRAAR